MTWLGRVVRRLRVRLVSEPAPEPPRPGKVRCAAVCGEVVLTLDGLPIGVLSPGAAALLSKQLGRAAVLCGATGGTH